MTTLPEMRNLAQRLVSYEAKAGDPCEPVRPTTLRVYEKLRLRLGELAGVAGFQSLASSALTLARSEVPSLSAVRVAADGKLQCMSSIDLPINAEKDRISGGGVILVSRLLELLFIFLGEALTMTLVRDVWPEAVFDDNKPWDEGKA